MFIRFNRMWVILVLLAAALSIGAVSLSAAPTADRQANEVKIEGLLTSYSGSMMVVAGQPIDVSQAVIRSGVAVGRLVEIYALPLPGGLWLAREVELDDDRLRNRAEITGVIEAINGTQVTIGGRAFDLRSAVVEGTLAVGSVVELKLVRTFSTTGTALWTVYRAELDDDDADDRSGRTSDTSRSRGRGGDEGRGRGSDGGGIRGDDRNDDRGDDRSDDRGDDRNDDRGDDRNDDRGDDRNDDRGDDRNDDQGANSGGNDQDDDWDDDDDDDDDDD